MVPLPTTRQQQREAQIEAENRILQVRLQRLRMSEIESTAGLPLQNSNIENTNTFETDRSSVHSANHINESRENTIGDSQTTQVEQPEFHVEVKVKKFGSPEISSITSTSETSHHPQSNQHTFNKDFVSRQERTTNITKGYLTKTPEMSRRSTIAEAFAALKSPAIPQFVSPPIFDPCKSDAETFLNQYERCSIANGWSENLKIAYFGTFLQGVANRWYEQYTKNFPNQTWEDVAGVFKEEFQMSTPKDAEFEFESRKQYESESIREYFFKLKLLAYEADRYMDDDRFIKYFERGLHKKFYANYHMLRPKYLNCDDLKELVAKLDDIHQKTPPQQVTNAIHTPTTSIAVQQHVQQVPTSSYGNNAYGYQPRFRQNNSYYSNNFHENKRQFNPRNYQRTSERTQQAGNTTLPVTRTETGRPRCYNCNKIGHYASACRFRASPNAQGRQN